MYTAYANTEYQTHYLNLAYTPSKAISLLIASKAFHRIPRMKSYGTYPADTLFDVFRVSYKEQLSEMNSEEEFYYSNTTSTQPKNILKLKHIAGVGNSPVVQYDGTGTYFLDQLSDGVWKLEVMPDAVQIRDPFERASPKKEVIRIQWRENKMEIKLPDFDSNFIISGLNEGNSYKSTTTGRSFFIQPGVYLITKQNGRSIGNTPKLTAFYAPSSSSAEPFVVHQSLTEVSSGKPFAISSKITGIDSADKISIEIRHSSNKRRTIPMDRMMAYEYKADVPIDMVIPGVISYRIMIQKTDKNFYTFPGGLKGNPYAWDEYRNESWQTYIAAPETPLELFNATEDRSKIMLYNPDWRNNTVEYITAEKPKQLVVKVTMNKQGSAQFMGWQFFFGDKISGRKNELSSFSKLVLKVRSPQESKVNLSLITTDADAYGTSILLTKDWKEIEVPINSLQKVAFLLLPRPYPGFLPLTFKSTGSKPLNIADTEKLEISFGDGVQLSSVPVIIEVESVWLK